MSALSFHGGTIILPDRLLEGGQVEVTSGRISAVREHPQPAGGKSVDLRGGYLVSGFVDLHVHSGRGADFMDGTEEAFRTVCRAHAAHGTTSLLPTSTVARHDQILAFLDLCRRFRSEDTGGARVLGAHFYGPYFGPEAAGCHPAHPLRAPDPTEYAAYLAYADAIATATVAPELPGAEGFVRACRQRGIRCNAGHSHATFEQTEAAVD